MSVLFSSSLSSRRRLMLHIKWRLSAAQFFSVVFPFCFPLTFFRGVFISNKLKVNKTFPFNVLLSNFKNLVINHQDVLKVLSNAFIFNTTHWTFRYTAPNLEILHSLQLVKGRCVSLANVKWLKLVSSLFQNVTNRKDIEI